MKKLGGSKFILLLLLIFIVLISLYAIIDYIYYPKITLKKGDIVINLNSKYKEPGYKATYKDEDITNNVFVEGSVNTKKLGVYNINYSVIEGSKIKEVTRKVYVKDLEKPTIQLYDNNDIYVCPDEEFVPSKYKAYDNLDKDITDKVKVIRKGASISYSVKDSSGNETVINKKIHYKDVEGPTISFKTSDKISLALNSKYNDDYTVVDNCDKDNLNVEVTGKVDVKTPGEYIVKYKSVDKYGNKTVKKKKVDVFVKGAKGTVYLTFDDGPREGTTASHNYSYIYSSIDNYFNDLESVQDRVYKITGNKSKIIRFPGGSSNTISRRYKVGIMSELTKEVVKRGYRYYDWNILSGDAGETTDSRVVYQMVTEKLSKDRVNVVLMHDIKSYTKDALRDIIKYGKENGFIFDKIEDSSEMIVQRVNN